MFAIAPLHLPDDDRDRRGVDIGSPHQCLGPLNVLGVNCFEEVIDFVDGRELFQNERAFEVCVVHRSPKGQYSPLITKNDPRIVPASLDFCFANLKRGASSAGTSIPSESLNPTARFFLSSIVYSTLIDRPLS